MNEEPNECEELIFQMLKEGEDRAMFSELEDMHQTLNLDYRSIEVPLVEATVNTKKEKLSPRNFANEVCQILRQHHKNIDIIDDPKKCFGLVCKAARSFNKWKDKKEYWEKRWDE